MKTNPIRQKVSKWTIIMNSDLIQWQNNLFETSRNGGVTGDMNGLAVIRLTEETAVTEIESQMESVWTIRINDDDILELCTTGKETGFFMLYA